MEGYAFYYGKVNGKENPLTYLGADYSDLDGDKSKESYVKIAANDLEAATVYFDCDKPGRYEICLSVEYSGAEKGEYISDPLKIYVVPYELEQEKAKILPQSSDSMLILLKELSQNNEKMKDADYKTLQMEIGDKEENF